jgi:co-chaperonin GroES (HSP10)
MALPSGNRFPILRETPIHQLFDHNRSLLEDLINNLPASTVLNPEFHALPGSEVSRFKIPLIDPGWINKRQSEVILVSKSGYTTKAAVVRYKFSVGQIVDIFRYRPNKLMIDSAECYVSDGHLIVDYDAMSSSIELPEDKVQQVKNGMRALVNSWETATSELNMEITDFNHWLHEDAAKYLQIKKELELSKYNKNTDLNDF